MREEFKWFDGKVDYDFVNDSFFVYSKSHKGEYSESITFDDFIIDVNDKNQVVSYEFLNASELFSFPKVALLKGVQLHGRFVIDNEKSKVVILIEMKVRYRNKELFSNFKRDIIDEHVRMVEPLVASIGI